MPYRPRPSEYPSFSEAEIEQTAIALRQRFEEIIKGKIAFLEKYLSEIRDQMPSFQDGRLDFFSDHLEESTRDLITLTPYEPRRGDFVKYISAFNDFYYERLVPLINGANYWPNNNNGYAHTQVTDQEIEAMDPISLFPEDVKDDEFYISLTRLLSIIEAPILHKHNSQEPGIFTHIVWLKGFKGKIIALNVALDSQSRAIHMKAIYVSYASGITGFVKK